MDYFSDDQWSRITNYYYEEADRRKRTKKAKKADIFREEESQEETSILHSGGIYNMKNNINSTLMDFSSFPWEEFSGDLKILENEVKETKILVPFLNYYYVPRKKWARPIFFIQMVCS